ncbi:hypothetical protein AAKU58_002750 [Oxalobacteraceae bacterium GrIS 1.18]
MAIRLANAVLVRLTAIFREERIRFSVAYEFTPICLINTLLDILDLPNLGSDVFRERSNGVIVLLFLPVAWIGFSSLPANSTGRRTVIGLSVIGFIG